MKRQHNIYVDNAATTSIDKKVYKAMKPFLTDFYGNPSSAHNIGIASNLAINLSRRLVADSIKATPKEIFFTGSASESNNWAIKSIAYKLKKEGKGNHIITSCIEHPSVLNTCKQLEKEGFKVTYLPVDEKGVISPYLLKEYLTKQTILITIMAINNELGSIQPIKEISKIAKNNNIIYHMDATQAIGNININIIDCQIDLMSFTAHKFYGPKGVGVLYVNKSLLPIEPLIYGGHQENGYRAGTENVASIVGMGKAIKQTTDNLNKNTFYIKKLRATFILHLIKETRKQQIEFYINNHFNAFLSSSSIPNIINIRFPNVEASTLLIRLNKKGIFVSSGSACSTGTLEPSYVLKAIGLSDKEAYESIRISIGKHNTKKQMKILAKELINSVKEILKEIDE